MKSSTRWLIASILLGFAAAAGAASAQSPTVTVETEYLGTLELSLDSPQWMGLRSVVNLPDGTIQGPKINGTVVAPSGNWLYPTPDGSFRFDVRVTIKTDDGQFILLEYNGVRATTKETMDRYNRGDVITSKEEYIVTTPRFTTASKKYDWLNRVQAVAKMVTIQNTSIKYDVFVVR
jgi:subtilisin-like proprotein convertase family protein